MQAMLFGWRVVKHVKSNAIVYASKDRTLGIGAGQMSRVDASRIAIWKAKDAGLSLAGSAVASDAFFPFPDGLIAAAEAGATCAIQPGGSVARQGSHRRRRTSAASPWSSPASAISGTDFHPWLRNGIALGAKTSIPTQSSHFNSVSKISRSRCRTFTISSSM